MQWTTKSRPPGNTFAVSANTASIEAGSVTSQCRRRRVEFAGQGLDPLAQGVALVGEGEVGPVLAGAAGDAPGDRTVVGDAEH